MAVFKCKMCGGTIEFEQGATVGVCDSCGSRQTLPKLDDDKKANLYDRANHFRRNNDYDKAMGIYEQILNEDGSDAEAYWSLVLCRYGIEYVEDPATHKRVPTVNRAQFTSIFDDEDYKSALAHADMTQKMIYEEEAAAINEIQKGILAISQKEEPFDVFICYKETDNDGRRTQDSVLANDLYHQLTQEGFKVFFSRITLEDKLGTAYEPYIFAALNSAKVMVVLGTKPEYFNAVWVKNEWSRYLALIRNGAKKMLIPAYRDMDPYDLPEEFSHLQAQDMSKLGFMQDLIRGIKKIVGTDEPKQTVKETVVVNSGNANTEPLLKRAFMFLEDGNWQEADEYCERVLDIDPECAEAYLGKLMAEKRTRRQEELKNCKSPFGESNNFAKAIRFGSEELKNKLTKYNEQVIERKKKEEIEATYQHALQTLRNGKIEEDFEIAGTKFQQLQDYKDSKERARECREKAKAVHKNEIYSYAIELMEAQDYDEAINYFKQIPGWKDADSKCDSCREYINDSVYSSAKNLMREGCYKSAIIAFQEISGWKDADSKCDECRKLEEEREQREEEERIESARKAEEARIAAEQRKARNAKIIKISIPIVCVAIAFLIILKTIIIPNGKYNDAIALMNENNLDDAYSIFLELGDYKDAADKANNILKEQWGEIEAGNYIEFGAYEQDNDDSNGKEAIEWLVLDVEDGKALIISKYALDCKQYNTSHDDVTWETCTLRNWLNDEFINSAFAPIEKEQILTTTVSADKNPEEPERDPGNETQDQVFLLSVIEANKYFNSGSEKLCKPTEYAIANGAKDNEEDGGYAWWWLRSPGRRQHDATIVVDWVYEGFNGVMGDFVDSDYNAVRPAMWISIE